MKYLLPFILLFAFASCCDDHDPCTLDTLYGSVPIVCHSDDTCYVAFCSDGICLTNRICPPNSCDDGDACTDDLKDKYGNCVYVPKDCNDHIPCTNDYCVNGQCHNDDVNCDDAVLCTNDHCGSVGGKYECINDTIPGCMMPGDSLFSNITDSFP